MKAKKIMAYECTKCGMVYEDNDSAIYCCSDVNSYVAYKCGKCDEIYQTKEDATQCCK